MKRVYGLIILICVFLFAKLHGQNSITFSNDLFSGINSSVISPTQPYLSSNPWDVNIYSGDLYGTNNFGYLDSKNFFNLLDKDLYINAIEEFNNFDSSLLTHNETGVYMYNNLYGKGIFSLDNMGPSVSIEKTISEKKYRLGLYTRQRLQASGLGIDNYFRFSEKSVAVPDYYELEPSKFTMMNWGEIGLNFSTELFPYSEKIWIIGGNIKYELGLDAAIVKFNGKTIVTSNISPVGNKNKDIFLEHFDISGSYANNFDIDNKRYQLKKMGEGLGLDLGITMMNPNDDDEQAYYNKLSFNILDLGYINYTKGSNHHFVGDDLQIINNPNFSNQSFNSLEDIAQTVSKEVYGDPNASYVGNTFKIGLPTSFNFTFSQNIGDNQYVNFNWIQRIPIFENSVKRNNMLNVNYLFQNEYLGYGASTGLSEYKKILLGSYFRLGPLVVGSENILPLFIKQQHFDSFTLYIAIKINPFWDTDFSRHRRGND